MSATKSNYAETIDFLFNSFPMFQNVGVGAYKPGLSNTIKFNEIAGNPDRRFISIHVAGTNGKGSVSHILASIFQSAGYRTGLFTSPHLKDFRERIRIDGFMMAEEEVVNFTHTYRKLMEDMRLSFFEMCTVMAFDHFAHNEVEIAIIETGLGGRLDSTNIITPLVSVITNIGLDHINLLGTTLPEIATEKAGIIKPCVPVIVGESNPLTDGVFLDMAHKHVSPLYFADTIIDVRAIAVEYDGNRIKQRLAVSDSDSLAGFTGELLLDLLGDYQVKNVATVLSVCNVINGLNSATLQSIPIYIGAEHILAGCNNASTSTGLRGRWEILSHSPLTVCDTGHNEHGISQVVAQLGRQNYRKLYFILGVVSDKDTSKILPILPSDAYYIFTRANVERAMWAEELARQASVFGLKGEISATVALAIARARSMATSEDMIFIGGSTFTVADAL